jgi:hypothetical protein
MQILLISNIGIGNANPDLDALLLQNYLQSFIASSISLSAICLYSNGVKLACTNSSVLQQLQILEQQGAKIFACTTCINFFELQGHLQVGELTTMPSILQWQSSATKIFML